jgi:Ca2+-binding RTX toxin-like protein
VNGTAGGNNVITLGSGTDIVNLGVGNDKVTLGTGTATVSFTGGSTTSNTVTLGSGADSVTFANGTNTVITTNADFSSRQTIHGGAGTDTIQISGPASVVDSDFAKVTGVEALKLGGTGANSVTVGADASADVGAGNTLTIDDSAGTGSLTVNATAMTAKVSITGGSGSNTITGGQAADSFFGHGTDNGNNTFVYNSAALAQNSLATNYDTITNFVSGTDSFKLDYSPTNLITVSHTGTGNLATDLASALGSSTLQYTSSVKDVALVTISSGADAGIYVVINSAHSSGYRAAQDAVIKMVGGTDPTAAHLSHDFG